MDRARGSKVYDVDGNEYIDFLLGYGPVLLGHCHPKVVQAVKERAENEDVYGIGGTEREYKLCAKLVEHVPSAKRVRLCNAGTDASFHAVRLARAYTGRKKLLKFEGSYHGWHDYLNVSLTPPRGQLGKKYPETDGMLKSAYDQTVVIPYNDLKVFEKTIRRYKKELAAVFVEPIQHNIGCIMPREGYLQSIREITEREGIVLVFDEFITGLRHDLGGYQKIIGVTPDLTCMAKALGNGYPIAAVCGNEEIMDELKPVGNVKANGTFYSHPISVAASLATLEVLETGNVYQHIFSLGEQVRKGLSELIRGSGIKAQVAGYRSIFWIYFTDAKIESYRSLLSVDAKMFALFHKEMLRRGIIFSPNPIKRAHFSAAHTSQDVDKLLNEVKEVLPTLKK
jgi:glutamate-1-semialdehyde 2,1-aminomutase